VAEQVTVELRRSILSGALAPGQEFSLREIADMLQVSFIPVREALRSLEGEGLVVTRPGRSALVAPLDLDELRGITGCGAGSSPRSPSGPACCFPRASSIGWSVRRRSSARSSGA
jgi:DNA-binding FadR family transcriptional regulator